MKRQGLVRIYNSDTGKGVIVAEDAGQLGDVFSISFANLAPGLATLDIGQRVVFDVTGDHETSVSEVSPITSI